MELVRFFKNVHRARQYHDLTETMGIEMLGQQNPLRKMLGERREQIVSQIDDPELFLGILPVELLDRWRDPLIVVPLGLAFAIAWRSIHSDT